MESPSPLSQSESTFRCPLCQSTFVVDVPKDFSDRSFLAACSSCQRRFIFSAPALQDAGKTMIAPAAADPQISQFFAPVAKDLSFANVSPRDVSRALGEPPVPSSTHSGIQTFGTATSGGFGVQYKPSIELELDQRKHSEEIAPPKHELSTSVATVPLPKEDESSLSKAEEKDIRNFLAGELGTTEEKPELVTVEGTEETLNQLKTFLGSLFREDFGSPPKEKNRPALAPLATEEHAPTKQTHAEQRKSPQAPPTSQPEAARPRRKIAFGYTLLRVALSVPQFLFDLVTWRGIDVLFDAYFLSGKNWAREAKRFSLLLCPPTVAIVALWLWPSASEPMRKFLWGFFQLSTVYAIFLYVFLGTFLVDRSFRGNPEGYGATKLRLFVFASSILYAVFAIRQLPVVEKHDAVRWPILSDRVTRFAPLPLALVDARIAQIAQLRTSTSQALTSLQPTPTPGVFKSDEKENLTQETRTELPAEVRATVREYLRPEIPAIAQNDIVTLCAHMARALYGDDFLSKDVDTIRTTLLQVMTRRYPYFMKPEAIRNAGGETRMVDFLEVTDSDSIAMNADLRNAVTKTVYQVKWRDFESVHQSLPSFMKATISVAELAEFYAPMLSVGEVFDTEIRLQNSIPHVVGVVVDYLMVPYIKINPSEFVFGQQSMEALRRANPVKMARVAYLFVEEEKGWRSVHHTDFTHDKLQKVRPEIKLPGFAAPLLILTDESKLSPRTLEKPQIQ